MEAAHQAFVDADILPTKETANRWGLVLGSGMMTAEFEYLQRFQQTCAKMEPLIGQHYKITNHFLS